MVKFKTIKRNELKEEERIFSINEISQCISDIIDKYYICTNPHEILFYCLERKDCYLKADEELKDNVIILSEFCTESIYYVNGSIKAIKDILELHNDFVVRNNEIYLIV